MSKKKTIPLVSVFMLTYNHEKYIAQALDSILKQRVDFEYEIVVGEDCSTDHTRKILLEYEKRNRGKFHLILHEENIGAMKNQEAVMRQCKGKYIAFLEGDDYWVDLFKLQKQVDFLEANEDYGLVYTNFLQKKDKLVGLDIIRPSGDIFNALIVENIIGTLTVMLRSSCLKEFIEECKQVTSKDILIGDLSIWLYVLENSKAKYFDEVTAVYRILDNSVSHVVNYHKKVRFLDSAYKIKMFFIERNKEKDLKESKDKFLIRYHKTMLRVSTSFKKAFRSYQYLKKHQVADKKDMIFFALSSHTLLRKTFEKILKKIHS